MSRTWQIYPCKKLEGWGKKSGKICRDLRAFLGVKFGLEDLLRVKDLTFHNSGRF